MERISRAASAAIIVLLVSTAAAAGVDSGLLGLAPPDSRTLAGVQVAQAQATPIGQALMNQLQLDPGTNRAFKAAGFDPRRDLQEIVLAIGNAPGGDTFGSPILFGRGTFHPAQIVAAAAAAGATTSTYKGVALIEAKTAGAVKGASFSGALAFLDATSMVAGDTSSLKAAIDRRAAHSPFSGPLADSARQEGASNDAWLVTLAPPAGATADLSAQLGPFGNILQAAVQLSAGLKLGATQVTLSADLLMRSPQDAQSMGDVLKFAIQMAQGNAAQGQGVPNVPFAQDAQITTSGSTMHLVLAVPEKQLEQLFLQPSAPAKRLAAR